MLPNAYIIDTSPCQFRSWVEAQLQLQQMRWLFQNF